MLNNNNKNYIKELLLNKNNNIETNPNREAIKPA